MIDFGTQFSQLASGFWWLLPLFVLAALFKSAWFKGFIGEVLVNLSARLFLDKNDYHLIKNVTIPTEDGTMRIPAHVGSRFQSKSAPHSNRSRRVIPTEVGTPQ